MKDNVKNPTMDLFRRESARKTNLHANWYEKQKNTLVTEKARLKDYKRNGQDKKTMTDKLLDSLNKYEQFEK